MINDNIDFVITRAKLIEWQKWLNQWIHTYKNIEIINSSLHENGDITIILKRIK
jgi:hypothetical protein